MPTVQDGQKETVHLPANHLLTVVAVTGPGRITRLDTDTGFAGVTSTSLVGPFAVPTAHRLSALDGPLTYSMAPVDFPTAAEALAAAQAVEIPVSGTIGDVKVYIGAGVPVDYTDGDPAATGEAVAGIGSLYIDTTNGKLYIQGGTKAQPVWKLVTSAT